MKFDRNFCPEGTMMFVELFSVMLNFLGLTVLDRNDWIPMAEQAVNLIYRLAEHPDDICADIIKKQAKAIVLYNANNVDHGEFSQS